jgi:hypothetical protein
LATGMWKQRLRHNSWKLVVLVISIVGPLLFDVPRIVKAAGGAVALAMVVAEVVAHRRRRREQASVSRP